MLPPVLHPQECDIRSKCCTPEGMIAPNGTLCKASRDPCSHDSFCDGVAAACPKARYAADDTLCSMYPFGLFRPVNDYSYSESSLTEDKARDRGYHKCYCCQAGACMPKQSYRKLQEQPTRVDVQDHGRMRRDWVWCR